MSSVSRSALSGKLPGAPLLRTPNTTPERQPGGGVARIYMPPPTATPQEIPPMDALCSFPVSKLTTISNWKPNLRLGAERAAVQMDQGLEVSDPREAAGFS